MKCEQGITGSNSITATRVLRKPAIKGYELLTKYFGVSCNIYAPIKSFDPKSNLHGFLDDDIPYEEAPYLQTKVLIPSLFRRRNSTNLSMLDPFIDSEIYAYFPADKELKQYSLIVCKLKSDKIYNWRINGIQPVENDAGVIIYRYPIVPVMSLSLRKNFDEIKKDLKKELEQFKKNEQVNTSMTEFNKEARGKLHYDPLLD